MFALTFTLGSLAPQTVNAAGFFSLITKETDAQELIIPNSQTLSLIDPVISTNRKNKLADASSDIDNNALVSKAGPSGTEADIDDGSPSPDEISIYTVRAGDTLPQIAKMFGVSANTIIWANDLPKNPTLKAGMTLTILPISGVSYKIKKGDTIAKIAKNFNADEEEIMQFNGIDDSSSLVAGESIIIPNGEIKDAPKPKPKRSSSDDSSISSNVSVPTGYFIRPVRGCIRTQGLHGHNGVDIGCPIGTPVYSAAEGTVIISDGEGYNGGYGKYVVVKHPNGTQTLYGHLSSIFVSSGQSVSQGDQVGVVGSTGKSTGPHLHWEVRGGTNPVAQNARYGL